MEHLFQAIDLAIIAAIVIITQMIKFYFPIPHRWIPLLPFIFGIGGAIILYDFSSFQWQGFLKVVIFYSAGASYAFNIWKKVIFNEK